MALAICGGASRIGARLLVGAAVLERTVDAAFP